MNVPDCEESPHRRINPNYGGEESQSGTLLTNLIYKNKSP